MKASGKLSRRAISPLIATIILIAICVVGGLLVYSIFMSTSGTMSAKGQVSVEAIDLVKNTEGNATFSITIKNTGNKPVVSLKVTLQGQNPLDLKVAGNNISDNNPLQPGQSATVLLNIDAPAPYVVGNSYNVVIEAKFSDGSMLTKTEAVMCKSGTMTDVVQVSVEAVRLVKSADGDVTFSITIKNTGNKPVVSLNVTLQGQKSPLNLQVAGKNIDSDNPLQPGQSATALLNINAPAPYVVGNSYNVVIEVKFSDGSMFTKTEAVMCRYG